MSRVRSTTDAENSVGKQLYRKCLRFNQVCGIDTMEVGNPLDRRNPDRCRETLRAQQLCRNVTASIKFVASTRWKFGIRWIEKTQFEYRTSSAMGHVTTRGARRQDMDSYRDFFHIATVSCLKHYERHGSFDHGPGYRVWCRFSTLVCQSRGILPGGD